MDNNSLTLCDTTRIDQREHDAKLFQETSEIIERFEEQEGFKSRRSVVISSEVAPEILSDYFKNAKFSRG